MSKKTLLSSIRVGHRVAEDEKNELANYFIKTSQWIKLSNGEIDVIYGAKGTGKSALYSLLTNNIQEFQKRKILLTPAENPLGASAFQELIDDNSCSESDLTYIWKLYILQLISARLRDSNAANSVSSKLIEALETAGLLPKSFTLGSLFSRAINYIKSFGDKDPTDIEWTLSLDPSSGVPSATRKASYGPTDHRAKLSSVPVNDLLHFANEGLKEENLNIWLLFDRLDVSFSSSPELEKSALRALFRVYADLKPYAHIQAKIFVRKDIWERITEGGFREASHVIKTDTIEWDRDGLLNLVISRLLNNQPLVDYLKVNKESVTNDISKQEEILKRIFPDKVDTGKNPDAFDWIVSRVQDGTKKSAPREIIHMLECLLASQIRKIEQGKPEPDAEILFDRTVFKESLSSVSEVRYRQTLCAEYPHLKDYTELLKNEKAEQKVDTLTRIWNVAPDKALSIADQLVAAGFFEARNDKNQPTYWVPFLYRDALDLIQGKAT